MLKLVRPHIPKPDSEAERLFDPEGVDVDAGAWDEALAPAGKDDIEGHVVDHGLCKPGEGKRIC